MENLSLRTFRVNGHLNTAQYDFVQLKANELFNRLMEFDWSSTKLREYSKIYFQKCHVKRLHFSIQCSAFNILNAIARYPNKSISELVYLDYGAGLGTSFMLAKLVGFKEVVYNDYNIEWLEEAQAMCTELNIMPDHFVKGDIVEVVDYCAEKKLGIDIISSRNVIEHLPDLTHYYINAAKLNSGRIIMVDSTSANSYNPLVVLNHFKKHKRIEKQFYFEQRKQFIAAKVQGLNDSELSMLSKACRMIYGDEIIKVANSYQLSGKLQVKPTHITNSREPIYGVWYEHILPGGDYCAAANKASFQSFVIPGFWDTHYKSGIINFIAKRLNWLIQLNQVPSGRWISPFMSVVSVKE